MDEEFGDLLFALVNTARFLKLTPEDALRRAASKFERRFRRAEKQLSGKQYGLEWFYEPAARLERLDQRRAALAGDRSAARVLGRHAALLRGLLEDK